MQVQFSNSSYEVNEDNGTVTVCVVKDMETAIAFNVTVTSRETRTIEGMQMHTSATNYMYYTIYTLAMIHITYTLATIVDTTESDIDDITNKFRYIGNHLWVKLLK